MIFVRLAAVVLLVLATVAALPAVHDGIGGVPWPVLACAGLAAWCASESAVGTWRRAA